VSSFRTCASPCVPVGLFKLMLQHVTLKQLPYQPQSNTGCSRLHSLRMSAGTCHALPVGCLHLSTQCKLCVIPRQICPLASAESCPRLKAQLQRAAQSNPVLGYPAPQQAQPATHSSAAVLCIDMFTRNMASALLGLSVHHPRRERTCRAGTLLVYIWMCVR